MRRSLCPECAEPSAHIISASAPTSQSLVMIHCPQGRAWGDRGESDLVEVTFLSMCTNHQTSWHTKDYLSLSSVELSRWYAIKT
eukprot:3162907-Rhodomonas_salina.2